MIRKILIDLDDVLADCTGAAMRHMGLADWKREYYRRPDRDIIKEYEEHTGILYEIPTFWEHFKREFWAELPLTPWALDLIDLCTKYVHKSEIAICTSPTKCGDCLAGKLDWIETYLPDWMHRQYLMTPRKAFCAAPGHVLIDDAYENTQAFQEAEGRAITFPQPWNHYRNSMGEELKYVKEWLDKFDQEGMI